jgi:DNA modification methylase
MTALEQREPIQILEGNCLELLQDFPPDCIDLIVTSPPYADARVKQYGGVPPEQYASWFLPIASEFYRVLKPDGTWILNIKEKCVHRERSCYVIKLILSLREQGWLWTEEFIWHKKTSVPGKWSTRFRDAWERLLQFNKSGCFKMYQDAVMIPCQPCTRRRVAKLPPYSGEKSISATGSPFRQNYSAWVGREKVYPTNVLYLSVESHNKKHCAAFPESLPEWFVKLFTLEGDLVLDPFLGSGTTGVVCRRLNRRFIGMELKPEYVTIARERIFATNNLSISHKRKEPQDVVSGLPLFTSESTNS